MQEIILVILKASIVISVVSIGLKATFADATFLFRHPVKLGRAFLSMNLVMPIVAVTLASAFDFHQAIKIALIVLSVSPIPPILPNKAFKAGGKEEYIIGLLVAFAVLAIIVIPATMEVVQWFFGIPLSMPFSSVAVLVLITILLPLLFGITIRKFAESLADRAAKLVGLIGLVLLAGCVLLILIGISGTLISNLRVRAVAGLTIFAVVGLITGHLMGGPEPANRHVLALTTSTRHPGIAIAIAQTNFPDQKLTMFAVILYVLISAILFAVYLKFATRTTAGAGKAAVV